MWIENIWRPEKQRVNDISIMEALTKIPGVKRIQLETANLCRVYMRVIMVSEIANMQGNAVPPGRLTGQWIQTSTLAWSELPNPPPKAWETFWRMVMKALGKLS